MAASPEELEELIQKLREEGLLTEKSIQRHESKVTLLRKELALASDITSKIQIQNELAEASSGMHQRMLQDILQTAGAAESWSDAQREAYLAARKAVTALQQAGAATQQVNQRAQTLLKTFTGVDQSIQQSLVFNIGRADSGFKDLGSTLQQVMSPMNMIGSLYQKMAQNSLLVFKQVDSLNAALTKETGLFNQSAAEVEGHWRALGNLGASLTEVKGATSALNNNMSQFNMLSSTARTELVNLTTKLGMAGASMEDASRTMNLLNRGFGMGTGEITRFYTELTQFSESLGMSLRQVNADLANFARVGAKYGRDMMGAFKDLEKQSKITGLSMQQLLGIADRFDTFEKAGESVGRLNAILGGPYLSAIDMLYAKEGQRVQMLRDTMTATGRAWNEMNRFERQAVAAAAGINDMAVASQLFGSSASEFNKMMRKQRELEDLAMESKAALDRLNEAFMKLTVAASPVLEVFSGFVGTLSQMMPKTKEGASVISGLLVIAVWGLGRSLRRTTVDIGTAAGALARLAATGTSAAGSMNTQATAASALALALARQGTAAQQAAASNAAYSASAKNAAVAAATPLPARRTAAVGRVGAIGGAAMLGGMAVHASAKPGAKGKTRRRVANALTYGGMGAMMAPGGVPGKVIGGVAGAVAGAAGLGESYAKGTPPRGVPGPRNAPRTVQAHGGEAIVPNFIGQSMSALGGGIERLAGLISQLIAQSRSTGSEDRDIIVNLDGGEVGRAVERSMSWGMGFGG